MSGTVLETIVRSKTSTSTSIQIGQFYSTNYVRIDFGTEDRDVIEMLKEFEPDKFHLEETPMITYNLNIPEDKLYAFLKTNRQGISQIKSKEHVRSETKRNHKIINNLLKLLFVDSEFSVTCFAECDKSFSVNGFPIFNVPKDRDYPKKPDFLFLNPILDLADREYTYDEMFINMLMPLEVKYQIRTRSLQRECAFDCLRSYCQYLFLNSITFERFSAYAVITDGYRWRPIKIHFELAGIAHKSIANIIFYKEITLNGIDDLKTLLSVLRSMLEFNTLKAEGEKRISFPKYSPKSDPVLSFQFQNTLHISNRSIVGVATDDKDNLCAIKLCGLDLEGEFENEIEMISQLQKHPNILLPVLIDRDINSNELFMISSLGDRLEHDVKLPLSESMSFQLLSDISDAFVYLHRKSLLYRDLHPGNVVLLDGQWKLIDFEGLCYEGTEWFPRGNLMFSSVMYMTGEPPNRYDDYESLFYLFSYCKYGTLPWLKLNDTVDICREKLSYLDKEIESVFLSNVVLPIKENISKVKVSRSKFYGMSKDVSNALIQWTSSNPHCYLNE